MNHKGWPQDDQEDPDALPPSRGLPLGLRILALVGALSFVMLGVNSLLPLLRWPPPPPAPPGPRQDTRTAAQQPEPALRRQNHAQA